MEYQSLEPRCVLAAIFPAYINGVFTLGDPDGASPYPLADTFELESLPGADKVIYLDYDGHHSVNNDWNHDIQFPAFDRDDDPTTFSDAELIEIQKNFQNVAEDYFPFGVNVTTKDPGLEYLTKSSASDTTYGIRSVQTQATDGFGGFGGIAFLNSFDDPIDNPVFVLNKGANVGAMTISHEVGHSVGLSHDGLGSQTYHPGTGGSGPTSWGPIMGAPFSANLTQWSPGDYDNSTNTEDDYSIITKPSNDFDFKPDDYGSTIATAAPLDHDAGNVFQWGIVERRTDVDVFKFTTGQGNVTFDINPLQERPNLDILARLYDQNGNEIAVSNPADDVNASFALFLQAGTYYLSIEASGLPGRYSDYGSIGFYTIEVIIIDVGGDSIGEAGVITNLNDRWQTIQLEKTYVDPVVVMGPATRIGGDPVTLRVDNVTSTSFDVQLDEWDYRDGRHVPERVSYMVFEAGEYQLLDGTIIKAGRTTGRSGWTTVDMSESALNATPVIFTQVMTTNGAEAVTTRIRYASEQSFQLRIQEQQANNPQSHGPETVGYIAVTPGSGDIGAFKYEVGSTGTAVNHTTYSLGFNQSFDSPPVFLAAMQSYTGGDPATVRLRTPVDTTGTSLFIEEEKSADAERRHSQEDVGFFAISSGFVSGQNLGGGGPSFIVAQNPDYNPGYAGLPGYVSTDKPEIWAALAEMESWSDVIIGDLSDDVRANENDPALLNAFFPSDEGDSDADTAWSLRSEPTTANAIGGLAGAIDVDLATDRSNPFDDAFQDYGDRGDSESVSSNDLLDLDARLDG